MGGFVGRSPGAEEAECGREASLHQGKGFAVVPACCGWNMGHDPRVDLRAAPRR